jgi:two-component system C4-dicarboxylate transport sensor histidine kinase DctB
MGEILLDVSPAAGLAALQAAVAAALCSVLGGALLFVAERRRALSVRLSNEAAVNAVLEQRVAERTRALEAANADLRHQITERVRAEAALKKAQADLVQAGKLSALGQMSAGISHELNQPLMAIRSFAENAEQFLDREQPEIARQNLQRIADLARRIGRIIKNLRAFARQETQAISDVDLGAVVDSVLEMAASRLARDQVQVIWTPPAAPVMVRGGEVRLQQVVMNLVSNALDAMEVSERPRLEITIQQGRRVSLSVRDSGPGIKEPDRMFDPFYTTKEVGHSEGLGLGLSISYGLVQSFGGSIRGRNHEGGGAELTMELNPASFEAAA